MEDTFRNQTNEPFVLGFVATCSGSGKTTLIEKLIIQLKSRGYRVGALKHDVHQFEMDTEGKDSYRFTKAGADQVMIASANKLGMVRILHEEMKMAEILRLFEDVDFIFLEGFRDSGYPKIEIHRKGINTSLLCNDPNSAPQRFYAVASDEAISATIPVLNLNDVEGIADWIEKLAKQNQKTLCGQ